MSLAKKVLVSPVEVVVGNRGQTCSTIDQQILVIDNGEKFNSLLKLLGFWSVKGHILIFVDKKEEADELFKNLYKVGYKTLVLHGGQDPDDREFTISDFRKGVRKIMIATSLAARGLDVRELRLVVNYKCPDHMEDYVH